MAELPPEPTGDLVHHRTYDVRAYREADDTLRIRGIVQDEKPAGMYIEDDPEPLSIHQMVVDLVIAYPSLEIIDAQVVMEITPHHGCTSIEPAYGQLVGISIARGFTRKVRELFGGPRGCTHVGALLQAMAPVAIQSMWSMVTVNEVPVELSAADVAEKRRQAMLFNTNTCHVWDEHGEIVARVNNGQEIEPPLWAVERLEKLGRTPEEWHSRA